MVFEPFGGPWTKFSASAAKLVILALVALLGTRLSYERIRFFLPGLGRREARAWLRRCRRDWARARERGQALLRWLAPGTVWAMDFSEAPTPIEGRYRYLLSVRDLASGMQLVALPCHDTTEATAAAALEAAFRAHGAPLVLKTDNGSAFTAGAFRTLLEAYGVTALYSPPRWPRYNGACEAGIGGLKTRAHHLSAWAGRPGEWTCEDVERARCYGNEFGRPFGRSRPVPAGVWSGRGAPRRRRRETPFARRSPGTGRRWPRHDIPSRGVPGSRSTSARRSRARSPSWATWSSRRGAFLYRFPRLWRQGFSEDHTRTWSRGHGS